MMTSDTDESELPIVAKVTVFLLSGVTGFFAIVATIWAFTQSLVLGVLFLFIGAPIVMTLGYWASIIISMIVASPFLLLRNLREKQTPKNATTPYRKGIKSLKRDFKALSEPSESPLQEIRTGVCFLDGYIMFGLPTVRAPIVIGLSDSAIYISTKSGNWSTKRLPKSSVILESPTRQFDGMQTAIAVSEYKWKPGNHTESVRTKRKIHTHPVPAQLSDRSAKLPFVLKPRD